MVSTLVAIRLFLRALSLHCSGEFEAFEETCTQNLRLTPIQLMALLQDRCGLQHVTGLLREPLLDLDFQIYLKRKAMDEKYEPTAWGYEILYYLEGVEFGRAGEALSMILEKQGHEWLK
jgi:hypothetical protein